MISQHDATPAGRGILAVDNLENTSQEVPARGRHILGAVTLVVN